MSIFTTTHVLNVMFTLDKQTLFSNKQTLFSNKQVTKKKKFFWILSPEQYFVSSTDH